MIGQRGLPPSSQRDILLRLPWGFAPALNLFAAFFLDQTSGRHRPMIYQGIAMRLTDILQPDCVRVPLQALGKQDAIYELVDLLAEKRQLESRDELRATVWQREQTRSTGIGHAVAIPHGKSKSCKQLCMAIGKAAAPIDYGAIDGKPVELIFLLCSPVDQTGPHIQALAAISRMLTDPAFRSAVRTAGTSQELFQLIADHEAKLNGAA